MGVAMLRKEEAFAQFAMAERHTRSRIEAMYERWAVQSALIDCQFVTVPVVDGVAKYQDPDVIRWSLETNLMA